MSLLAVGGAKDGCAWYRVEVPTRWMRERGIDVRVRYEDVSDETGDLDGVTTLLSSRGCDVSLVMGAAALQDRRGVRVVYDLDDDVWAIPEWNYFSQVTTPAQIKNITAMCRLADLVTVPTAALADKIIGLGGRARVIPNALPLSGLVSTEKLAQRQGVRRAGFRVGWAGSATHVKDLEQIHGSLAQLMIDCPDVTLVFMGWTPKIWDGCERVESHPWVQPPAYYEALGQLDLDVFVAPLAECEFNLSKSDIKLIEAAGQGWPIVATNFGPYAADSQGVPAIRVAVDRADAWHEALVTLYRDAELRRALGRDARRHVELRRMIDQTGPQWVDALGLRTPVEVV